MIMAVAVVAIDGEKQIAWFAAFACRSKCLSRHRGTPPLTRASSGVMSPRLVHNGSQTRCSCDNSASCREIPQARRGRCRDRKTAGSCRRRSGRFRGPCRRSAAHRRGRARRSPARSPRPDRRSRDICGRGRAPARIASRIAAGSSERGLSSVTITASASRAATSPMIGRLPASRSPPQPKTTMSCPSLRPQRRKTFSSASGLCA